jgi:hypothetical protein
MSSSGMAFSFFNEWMNAETKLCVIAVLEDVCISGFGWIKTVDVDAIFLAWPDLRFSIRVPLAGCTFEASDPEHSCGLPALDELTRDVAVKFGWEIVLPSNGRILLTEFGEDAP